MGMNWRPRGSEAQHSSTGILLPEFQTPDKFLNWGDNSTGGQVDKRLRTLLDILDTPTIASLRRALLRLALAERLTRANFSSQPSKSIPGR